jgi:alpha-L-arabinofuranosidase
LADARARIDPAVTIGAVDGRLFGSFVEHMGRAIYSGIYEPGHRTADGDGWRRDVLGLVRRLGVSLIRYPGGNFVSGYDWEDGVGPRPSRPVRQDRAWRSIEPNLVGTDDFITWARRAGAEPMLVVNLGTRGAEAARNLVEYVNAPCGTTYSDERAANGHPEPYDVRTWGLGNEMDGPWQIGHKTAAEYGRLAAEAGSAMRLVDPTIELVTCGSSGSGMPTFGAWERTVLDLAWDVTDHVSVHGYYDPAAYDSVAAFLACSRELDEMLVTVAGIADSVAEQKGSAKRIGLSVDEWNVWRMADHLAREAHEDPGGRFRSAPALAEDEQDLADALVVGCLLMTLLRHADRVRIACLAQLVNVIAPIRTIEGGPAWLQTTAYPFADVTRLGHGTVLDMVVDGPEYAIADGNPAKAIEAVAVHDAEAGRLTLFAVNRVERSLVLEADVCGFDRIVVEEHRILGGTDLQRSNTAIHPLRVVPYAGRSAAVDGRRLVVQVPPRSWNVVRMSVSTELAFEPVPADPAAAGPR